VWEDSHAHLIIATRTYFGEAAFSAWAWRIPFLFSFLLVFIAFYMRLQFQESPIYAEIKAKGETSKNRWREAFLSSNIKFVLIATIVVLGQGVVWSQKGWASLLGCPLGAHLPPPTAALRSKYHHSEYSRFKYRTV
jgi:MFS family permease